METYELLVLGGGFAGVAAAIAASRRGVRTLLVEKEGCLGGAAANNLVFPFMGNHTKIDGADVKLSQGLFREIDTKLKGRCGALNGEYLKKLLDDMLEESGAKVLYHAALAGVNKAEDGSIVSLVVTTKAGLLELEAERFIDATGDADLAVLAGCPYRLGRPEDSLCQPMTTCFRVANVDVEAFWADRPRLNVLYREKQEAGEIKNPRGDILVFQYCVTGMLHFNTTRVIRLDPVDPFDLSEAERTARAQVFEMFDFLKENAPSFEKASLVQIAPAIGVRESRMIDGAYVLTGDDIKACTVFDDSIACGNYDIDIHDPDGSGTSHYYFPQGQYYTVPYRSLVPKTVKNLLVAGRCISCTHEAQASIRIMPIVCTLGEAAGVAAAQAKAENTTDLSSICIPALQKKLLENGAKIR